MTKLRNLLMATLLASACFSISVSLGEEKPVKVFLIAGHSNIGGGGVADDLDPAWSVPQDSVWIWLDHNIDGVGAWATLEPGHGGPTHTTRPDDPEGITPGGDGRLKIGPELSLGRALADAYPEDRLAFIKHARSGTIGEWSPENVGPPNALEHPWSGLLQKTNDAFAALRAAGHAYEVEGFFWSLGGRDARNWNSNSDDTDAVVAGREEALARSAVYKEGLETFIVGARSEFGANLPFVIAKNDHLEPGLQERGFPGLPLVSEAQNEVATLDAMTTVFSTVGLTVTDGVHFDAIGQIEQGRRFANAYFELLSQTVPGDYNRDGRVDVLDIDLQAIAMGEPNPDLEEFDENEDGIVDVADRAILIGGHANTFFGDSNLDGEFNSSDLVTIFQAGQYEDAIDGNSTWVTGDWDGDRDFGTQDLVLAFQDGGFEQGSRRAFRAVPEPTSVWFAILAGIPFATFGRRQRRNPANPSRSKRPRLGSPVREKSGGRNTVYEKRTRLSEQFRELRRVST